jgi:hypothetical protein
MVVAVEHTDLGHEVKAQVKKKQLCLFQKESL